MSFGFDNRVRRLIGGGLNGGSRWTADAVSAWLGWLPQRLREDSDGARVHLLTEGEVAGGGGGRASSAAL